MKRFFFLFLCFIQIGWGQDASIFSSHIQWGEESKAGYLSLSKERPIDNTTYLYIRYALEEFRAQKVSFVLLDLDTPGGEVFSALRIVEQLQKIDREAKIPVVAFVDNWALSAGALLAYSCRFIGATSLASMGAAEPVIISQDGSMQTAEEKMVSALRVEFAKAATLYHRDPLIAEAMVDKNIVAVRREGKIISLLSDEKILPSDDIIASLGKLLTLDAKQMVDLSVANFCVPALGVLTGKTSIRAEPFFDREITWISYTNWKIDFFAFLSHPIVSSCLMFGLMIGLYGFIQNPSSLSSAFIGAGSIFFIMLSTFATQMVGILEIVIVCAGLVLLAIDLLFVASGFMTAVAAMLLLGGLISMLLPSLEGSSISWDLSCVEIAVQEWLYRLSLFLASFLVAFVVCIVLSRLWWHKGPWVRKLVLESFSSKEVAQEGQLALLRGAKGKAVSALCPFGKVLICGTLYEAETEGNFIFSSAHVEVIGIKNNHLIVREL